MKEIFQIMISKLGHKSAFLKTVGIHFVEVTLSECAGLYYRFLTVDWTDPVVNNTLHIRT